MPALAAVNQKGGVGKTTTVVNLGAYLGALNSRVLLVDCDPQANTTSALGQKPRTGSLHDVLHGQAAANDVIIQTGTNGVDLLPSSPELAGSEIELLEEKDARGALKEALATMWQAYDYVLLDCPPSLGLLTVNALVAADEVLIPVQCEYLALEGLARLLDTLERVRSQWNPTLAIFGLVMTMYDGRTVLSQQVANDVRRHYPRLTFETVIPRNVRLGEAPSFGQSILEYDPLSRGAEAYQALAMEVAARAGTAVTVPERKSVWGTLRTAIRI
ncbi:MAG TPA: ParA family protein [Chloroflexota bacterium]